MKNNALFYTCLSLLALSMCKPKTAKEMDLPSPSQANFDMVQYVDPRFPTDKNTYIFTNTTDGGFVSSWDFGGLEKSLQPVDTVFFAYKGTYDIKLISASKGGSGTLVKSLTIAETSPYAADFAFTKVSDWKYKLEVTTPANFVDSLQWSFSNGVVTTARDTSAYFPWKGSWKISLKVFTPKGSSTLTKDVVISNDDPNNPALTDPVFTMLTGGPSALNGKTWLISKFVGVGPPNPSAYDGFAEVAWYKNGDGSITGPDWDEGAKANEYTFKLRDFQYIPKNQKATIHYDAAKVLFGKNQAQYDDIPYDDPSLMQAPFVLRMDPNVTTPQKYSLTLPKGNHLGYNQYRSYYEIVRITDDTLYVRQPYNDVVTQPDGGMRYFKYAAKK